jgi:hypothetical protein
LKRDERTLERNRRAVRELVRELEKAKHPATAAVAVSYGWLLRGVPVGPILSFLKTFGNHPLSLLTDSGPVTGYIEARQTTELAEWDVLFTSLRDVDEGWIDESTGLCINCQRRTVGTKSDANTLRITEKQRVASRGVESAGLTPAAIEEAQRKYRESNPRQPGVQGPWHYPDKIYRLCRPRPLLIVHLLRVDESPKGPALIDKPVVAWGISFPATQHPELRVSYIVNTTWLREQYQEEYDDVDEDEMRGDND